MSPQYELKCDRCGQTNEQLCKFEDINYLCECGGKLEQIFYPIETIYKTTGFYSTSNPKPIKARTNHTRAGHAVVK